MKADTEVPRMPALRPSLGLRSGLSLAAVLMGIGLAQAQQRDTIVTLLSGDQAAIGGKTLAVKDVPSRLTSLSAKMVLIRNCERVSADSIQALAKELQSKQFIVVMDARAPDAGLCPR